MPWSSWIFMSLLDIQQAHPSTWIWSVLRKTSRWDGSTAIGWTCCYIVTSGDRYFNCFVVFIAWSKLTHLEGFLSVWGCGGWNVRAGYSYVAVSWPTIPDSFRELNMFCHQLIHQNHEIISSESNPLILKKKLHNKKQKDPIHSS